MIFKPDKSFYRDLILEISLYVGFCIVMLSDGGKIVWLVTGITTILVGIYFILNSIATGRTIIMNEEGCIVSLLRYRREYKWDDFQIKTVVNFRPSLLDRLSYNKAAVFSTKSKIYNTFWWNPIDYSWMFHPLTFVFINFTPRKKWIDSKVYEIDEEEFMSKMRKWNVELDEIKKKELI